jgi:hypothetical protein
MVHEMTKIFQWETREFDDHKRGKTWFWILGGAVLIGIVGAIFLKNYILAALVLIGGATLFLYSRERPGIMSVEVSEQGVKIGTVMYYFNNLDAFWLADHENGETHLLLHSDQSTIPIFSVPVGDGVDILDLRDYLGVFLEEREMMEPLLQRISYRLRF